MHIQLVSNSRCRCIVNSCAGVNNSIYMYICVVGTLFARALVNYKPGCVDQNPQCTIALLIRKVDGGVSCPLLFSFAVL